MKGFVIVNGIRNCVCGRCGAAGEKKVGSSSRNILPKSWRDIMELENFVVEQKKSNSMRKNCIYG